MSAAYSTGSATGPIDLLQKIVTFLVAQGWTSDSSVTYGTGWRAHLHKNGQYVHFRALANEAASLSTAWGASVGYTTAGYGIAMYLGDGYNGSNAWNAQSNGPVDVTYAYRVGVGMLLSSSAIPTYHFLDDGNDNVMIIADKGSGNTAYLGWGPSLVRSSTLSDWYFFGSAPHWFCAAIDSYGPYYGSTLPAWIPASQGAFSTNFNCNMATLFVRVDASIFGARWCSNTDTSTSSNAGYTGFTGKYAWGWFGTPGHLLGMNGYVPNGQYVFQNRGWQTSFVGALLLPIHIFMLNANGRYNPVGYPPSVFAFAGVGHGFSSGQIAAIGGVNYLVFANFAVKKLA